MYLPRRDGSLGNCLHSEQPARNLAVHSRESNSQDIDYKSDVLTISLPSCQFFKLFPADMMKLAMRSKASETLLMETSLPIGDLSGT